MRHAYATIAVLCIATSLLAGCAAGRAFGRGEDAARGGNWDAAVEHYRTAVQKSPSNPEYRIAYERAMISASQEHLDQARIAEARGQLEDALREYRRASEFDPPNRQLSAKVLEIERTLRDRIEAQRQPSSVTALREQARQNAQPSLFNLNTVMAPIRFQQSSVRDILSSIAKGAGINITYDSTYQDRVYTVDMSDVTLGNALNQIVTANQLFYKVLDPKTILVIPDNAQKRAQYEEQLVQNFFISHVDPLEVGQMLNQVIRPVGGQQLAPVIAVNKTANVVTVRATTNMMAIIEKMIESYDKPRAEVVVDVQILEVSRTRARQYGLDLGNYAINAVFSPEADPRTTATTGADAGTTSLNGRAFNANTITRGISANDFYLAVPSAVVRFLETDSETRVMAKPQLRGAEGVPLSLNLGEDIPVPSTTFTPVAAGGANSQPLTSFGYRTVGIIVKMTAHVSYDNEIRLELEVESSTLGAGINIAGQDLPSFGSRKVTTTLRLREGEPSLLAGLLREDQRRLVAGFPYLLHLPVIKQLFSNNDNSATQTDIVMLLTPRIVRTHELTPEDIGPIRIGTQANLGLSGPPPLLAAPTAPAQAANGAPPVGNAAGLATPNAPASPNAPPTSPNAPIPPTAVQPASPAGVPPAAPAPVPGPPGGPTGPPAGAVANPGTGQIVVSAPPEFRLSGGPYTVPISITGASQISSVSLTVTYNPAVLRVSAAQEGTFLRAGGVAAVFNQQPDPSGGRLDLAIIRPNDLTGVAGTGLLAALVFETIAPGPANLMVTGSASGPNGAPVTLQFGPVPNVTVR
jgi:type II secretory pathway component GspD/PulD (secretin)